MLKVNPQSKLNILKILLYSVIIFILLLSTIQGFNIYKNIKSLSATKVSDWINSCIFENQQISIKNINIDFQYLNLNILIEGVEFRSKQGSNLISPVADFGWKIGKITAQVNIIKIILAGKIRLNDFSASDIVVNHNSLYPQATIDQIDGIVRLTFNNSAAKRLGIQGNFKSSNINFNISTTLTFYKQVFGFTKFKFDFYDSDVRQIIRLLPANLVNLNVITWIDQALLAGKIISGELVCLPSEEFNLKIKFKEIKLKYAENWPEIENLSANLNIINNDLEIKMIDERRSATIFNQPINKLVASIKNINLSGMSSLYIYGHMTFPGAQGLKFLNSISRNKTDNNLENISLDGKVNLVLNLEIPLEDHDDPQDFIKYHGVCKTKNANLKFMGINVEQLSASITFDNTSIVTEEFSGKIFGTTNKIDWAIKGSNFNFVSPNLKFNLRFNSNYQKIFLDNWNNLYIDKLTWLDTDFKNIKLIKNLDEVKIDFQDDQIQGIISYNQDPQVYKVNLEKLRINPKYFGAINKISPSFLDLLPKITFNCNNLFIDNLYFGKVKFSSKTIKNELNQNNQLAITDVSMSTDHIFAKASVDIDFNPDLGSMHTMVAGKLNVRNFGSGMRDLNLDSKLIANGTGNIDFNIEFIGDNRNSLGLKDITAQLNLQIKSGFILGLDPGIGRILGLLSVENIPKRLALDFSDLTNKGFSFDSLIGSIYFKKNIFILDNLKIIGPSANIVLKGSIDPVSQQVDLLAAVTSKTGATLPLAAAVAAGNPLVGAAVWLFDYASGAKFSKAKLKEYKINGIWDKLQINPVQ